MAQTYIGEIDILITEGTMLSRIDETKQNLIRTALWNSILQEKGFTMLARENNPRFQKMTPVISEIMAVIGQNNKDLEVKYPAAGDSKKILIGYTYAANKWMAMGSYFHRGNEYALPVFMSFELRR